MRSGREKRYKLSYPIDLASVRQLLRLDYARHHYSAQLHEEKRKEAIRRNPNAGMIVTMTTGAENEGVEKCAEASLLSGQFFDRPEGIYHGKPWDALEDALQVLEKKGITEISRPLLPLPDYPQERKWFSKGWDWDYSTDRLCEYLVDFFHLFFEEYARLVETNFPTLKSRFDLYSKLPVSVYAEVHRPPESAGHIDYLLVPRASPNVVQVFERSNQQRIEFGERAYLVHSRGETLSISRADCTEIGAGLRDFFYSSSQTPFSRYGERQDAARAVIRNAVYKQVRDDLNKLTDFMPDDVA